MVKGRVHVCGACGAAGPDAHHCSGESSAVHCGSFPDSFREPIPAVSCIHTATTQVARWTQGTILFGGLIDELLSPAKKEQGNLWLRLAKTAGSWVAGVICFGLLAMITISGKVGWVVLGMAVAVGVAANASQSGKGTE